MLQRIGASSGLIIAAIILFLIFTFLLFALEKRGEKKRAVKKARRKLYIVPPIKKDKAA